GRAVRGAGLAWVRCWCAIGGRPVQRAASFPLVLDGDLHWGAWQRTRRPLREWAPKAAGSEGKSPLRGCWPEDWSQLRGRTRQSVGKPQPLGPPVGRERMTGFLG